MDIRSRDFNSLVCKRAAMKNTGRFSIDSRALAVLMEMDGQQNLAAIALKTGINMADMRGIVSELFKLKLIAPVSDRVKVLGNGFYRTLGKELALAVGPIAQVLIEDAVLDLGFDPGRLPAYKAAELVEMLAREIQREDQKAIFAKKMIAVIKAIKD